MKEKSNEAKQAAEEWVAPVEITSFREAYAYGYDDATAKLREEKGEATELARQLGAVAKECDVVVRYVLGLLVVPPEARSSAEKLDAWLAEVKPQ